MPKQTVLPPHNPSDPQAEEQPLSLMRQISHNSQHLPHNISLVFGPEPLTYRQLETQSNQVANLLSELEIEAGDRVAVLLPNCLEFVLCYVGILKLGAVAVMVNTALTEPEVGFILADSQAKLLLTNAELQERVTVKTLPDLAQVVLTTVGDTDQPTLADRMAQIAPHFQASELPSEAPALLLYTSGTTGTPKGATLSVGCLAITTPLYVQNFELNPEDKVLLFLSAFHCYGLGAALTPCLYAGATLVLLPEFEIEAVLKAVAEQQVTIFYGVPTIYTLLLNQAAADQLQGVKRYISAGATLPWKLGSNGMISLGWLLMKGTA